MRPLAVEMLSQMFVTFQCLGIVGVGGEALLTRWAMGGPAQGNDAEELYATVAARARPQEAHTNYAEHVRRNRDLSAWWWQLVQAAANTMPYLLIPAQVAESPTGPSVVMLARQEDAWEAGQPRPGLKPWATLAKPAEGGWIVIRRG